MQAIFVILLLVAIVVLIWCLLSRGKTEKLNAKTAPEYYLKHINQQLSINAMEPDPQVMKDQRRWLKHINTEHKKYAPMFEKCPLYKANPAFFVATFVFGAVAKGLPVGTSNDYSQLIEETCKIMYQLK